MSTFIVLYPKVSVQYEVKKKKGREGERKEEREGKETTSQNEQGKKHRKAGSFCTSFLGKCFEDRVQQTTGIEEERGR